MKTILTFILISLTSILSYGQGSKLVLFSENQESFFLYINNTLQNRLASPQVMVESLQLKNYEVKVVFKNITLGTHQQSIKVKPNREQVFVLFKDKDWEIELYSKAKRGMFTPNKSIPKITPYEDYNGLVGCPTPVSDKHASIMLENLKDAFNDDERMTMIKRAVQNRCFTVAQLKGFIKTLDFEDNRIIAAKFAYSFIYDRGNYHLLSSTYNFPYSFEDVNNYIGK